MIRNHRVRATMQICNANRLHVLPALSITARSVHLGMAVNGISALGATDKLKAMTRASEAHLGSDSYLFRSALLGVVASWGRRRPHRTRLLPPLHVRAGPP
jgi:hypothetical protein